MADPLGLIGGAGAGGIRGPQGPGAFRPLGPDGPGEGAAGSSFKDVLMKNINEVNQLQAEATAAQEDIVSGKRGDVEGVVLATQKADTAFRALLAVRNKVQAAYEELKQVRI